MDEQGWQEKKPELEHFEPVIADRLISKLPRPTVTPVSGQQHQSAYKNPSPLQERGKRYSHFHQHSQT